MKIKTVKVPNPEYDPKWNRAKMHGSTCCPCNVCKVRLMKTLSVPVIPNLNSQILNVLESGKGTLDMDAWHTRKTTHCVAGWATTLGGRAGKRLQDLLGTPEAAELMFRESATGLHPDFFSDSNEVAKEELRSLAAAEESLASEERS